MKFEVEIHKMIENGKPLKAVASVILDGKYIVHNIRVIQTDKGTFMAMPFEIFDNKEGIKIRKDVFHPLTTEARKAMEEAVISAYRNKAEEAA